MGWSRRSASSWPCCGMARMMTFAVIEGVRNLSRLYVVLDYRLRLAFELVHAEGPPSPGLAESAVVLGSVKVRPGSGTATLVNGVPADTASGPAQKDGLHWGRARNFPSTRGSETASLYSAYCLHQTRPAPQPPPVIS